MPTASAATSSRMVLIIVNMFWMPRSSSPRSQPVAPSNSISQVGEPVDAELFLDPLRAQAVRLSQ